jgi:hypothetical protein
MRREPMPAFAGLREWRVCRASGARIAVYDGVEAGMDTDAGRWQTVCETHGSITSHRTLALARLHAAWPEWCESCASALAARSA